ncbi:MAG: helix-turn-helix transcriptional regulator [Lachnospiraceae bacterium]|nr:helix-turn-helix transcriptional regulator [Lachnospiraceae bacterium]MDD7023587.1 helix-turn-helix transcriptional regulator [Oscillospiraceae bacterium]MDY5541269.1 helix-turn-helix transcriptional regulator [Lachnospiraceae bacterium]MDY5648341.1 helix-turn-helix transcriptional regulator [Lachnospiraceae bacterium]
MKRNLRMKAARQDKGLSQEELARLAGVSRQTINMIERGDFNPSLHLCLGICRILGRTLDELFWEEEES